MTALVWDEPSAPNFLHLGASFRSVASAGTLRYRGRPGSNVTANFIDTGSFAADGAFHHGVEGLLDLRNMSLWGEWVAMQVNSPETGNPRFTGWHLAGSWVLTGEICPYDRNM